jgi:hypothetical protein
VDASTYCYEIGGAVELSTGTILWEEFSSTCWTNDPPDFPGAGSLTSIDFTAPGSTGGAREPSFCLVRLAATN